MITADSLACGLSLTASNTSVGGVDPQVRPVSFLGGVGYSMIACGAFITALSHNLQGYALGFLLIVAFDKMFNVYMRTVRQQAIPPQDFGKTVGVITLLNNVSQPLAGLLVAVLAAPIGTQYAILILAVLTALLGASATWCFAQGGGRAELSSLEVEQKAGK